MQPIFEVESLLSARLFLSPQLVDHRIYFVSDLSGRLSLYAIDEGGSIPEPLLPRHVALQNPTLIEGELFYVFPRLGKILVLIDHHGDENYQPMFVPIGGGALEPIFGDRFKGMQVKCSHADPEKNLAVFQVDNRQNPIMETFLADLAARELTSLGTSIYGNWFSGHNDDYSKLVLLDGYTAADTTAFLWERSTGKRRLLYGTPLDNRKPGQQVPLSGFGSSDFTADGQGLVFFTSLFSDRYGLGYLSLADPQNPQPVEIVGTVHTGEGELHDFAPLGDGLCRLDYTIDGVSYDYLARYDAGKRQMQVERTLAGTGPLANGVVQRSSYDKESGRFVLSFSTATSPAQLYIVDGDKVEQQTRERILGIGQELLAPGEDDSYSSHDGLRVSSRLYLPSPALGFKGPRPVIFYIHGGPQSAEKPDFTWFSMPLIQFFTLNGFAVHVPNVRGSSGYGLEYMKRVDRDWGGKDRLDHVAGFEHLKADPRLDMSRVGVMGRSYGGYMTLTLAGRHPDLWKAACDMFGPYNLASFMERLPDTWKTMFYLAIGNPETEMDEIQRRSPSTYLHQMTSPLLVIQGRNDPRVVEAESRDVVEKLRAEGKDIEYIVFENEGHDVIKFENKVRVYNEIVRFFKKHLAQ